MNAHSFIVFPTNFFTNTRKNKYAEYRKSRRFECENAAIAAHLSNAGMLNL